MYYTDELIFLTIGEHISLHDEGENHLMYGKHHTAEARNKMSEAAKGKQKSEEHRKKISNAHKGKTVWSKGKKEKQVLENIGTTIVK